MTIVSRLREAMLAPDIDSLRIFYESRATRNAGHVPTPAWQLDRFNALWPSIRRHVPFYRGLANAPPRFQSWTEVQSVLPRIERSTAKSQREALISAERPPDQWRSTGGSTGEPLQFPVWDSEEDVSSAAVWLARGWFGVTPRDSLFLLWGHSHALGTGVRGWIKRRERELRDRLLGYHRQSAYDLSDAALHRAADVVLRARPRFIVGYSSALHRFAEANRDRANELRALRLKIVVATAEAFPRPGSAQLLEEVFGCPVVMEYGSVESGPIAHQTPQGAFHAFWHDYFLELHPSPSVADGYELLLTALYPRNFPLLRYSIGDIVRGPVESEGTVTGFAHVVGRCNDFIETATGQVHSEAIAHVLKEMPVVLAYQVHQGGGEPPALHLVTRAPIDAADMDMVRHRLAAVSPELTRMPIYRVAALTQTVAGKTPSVISRRPGQP